MRIALASVPVKTKNISYNLQSMLDAIKACNGKADLIVFGESVLQGFDCLCWLYETDCNVAVTLTDGAIKEMRKAAKESRMAVSFGFIERSGSILYSSQIFIGATGEIVNLFHRVSVGWKEYKKTGEHYQEGAHFKKFSYNEKTFAIGLCGDLWAEGRPEEMKALNADIILWPVWCDYDAEEWNVRIKKEYADQAALCGKDVFLVNPLCADGVPGCAAGGCVWFQNGSILKEHPAGSAGLLIVEME